MVVPKFFLLEIRDFVFVWGYLKNKDQQKQNESKDDMVESDIEFVETGPQVIEIPDANDSSFRLAFELGPHAVARLQRSIVPLPRLLLNEIKKSASKTKNIPASSHLESVPAAPTPLAVALPEAPAPLSLALAFAAPPARHAARQREVTTDNVVDRDRDRMKDKEKSHKDREADKEKQREREKKGLPPIKKENLSVCSTTLWVGHVSKLATQEELSDLFGAVGGVAAIDVVAPRGCAFVVMERRRDAHKALTTLNKHKLHSKEIKGRLLRAAYPRIDLMHATVHVVPGR
ncbi:hypothetical protein MSG28_009915 [Choristoneura fumiferana]|uniref:Uncharacterized protein n=1 Tax=Choristoneura fumiferana TaxID=7141 RepID=A0ACC0JDB6_CHOFU|nr:hypothetical protein MSG28_009915 [Choristoneura fumiferana]